MLTNLSTFVATVDGQALSRVPSTKAVTIAPRAVQPAADAVRPRRSISIRSGKLQKWATLDGTSAAASPVSFTSGLDGGEPRLFPGMMTSAETTRRRRSSVVQQRRLSGSFHWNDEISAVDSSIRSLKKSHTIGVVQHEAALDKNQQES